MTTTSPYGPPSRFSRVALTVLEVIAGGVVTNIIYGATQTPLTPDQILLGLVSMGVLIAALVLQRIAARFSALWALLLFLALAALLTIHALAAAGAENEITPTARTAAMNAPDLYLPAASGSAAQRVLAAVQTCQKLPTTAKNYEQMQQDQTVVIDGRCFNGKALAPVGAYPSPSLDGEASALLFTGAVLHVTCQVTNGVKIAPSTGQPSRRWLQFDNAGIPLFFPAVWTQGPLPSKACADVPRR